MKDFDKLIKWRNTNKGFAATIGVKITYACAGYAEGEIAVGEQHFNTAGTVHGGCLFALMDTVGGCAALTGGNMVTTSNSDIYFLRPAADLEKLKAKAQVIKDGRTLIVVDVALLNEHDVMIAKGSATFFRLNKTLEELDI